MGTDDILNKLLSTTKDFNVKVIKVSYTEIHIIHPVDNSPIARICISPNAIRTVVHPILPLMNSYCGKDSQAVFKRAIKVILAADTRHANIEARKIVEADALAILEAKVACLTAKYGDVFEINNNNTVMMVMGNFVFWVSVEAETVTMPSGIYSISNSESVPIDMMIEFINQVRTYRLISGDI